MFYKKFLYHFLLWMKSMLKKIQKKLDQWKSNFLKNVGDIQ